MPKNITVWTPSTCGCEIQYEWDSEDPAEVRMHKVVSVQHCGGDHPDPVVGEHLEGSAFHEDHVVQHSSRDHWEEALRHNPHWKTRAS